MEYTAEDYSAIKKEVNKKLAIFAVIAGVIIGCIGVMFWLRWQAACYWATFIVGGAYIFFAYIYLVPPVRYRRFLNEVANGQQRITEVRFLRFEEGEDVRDGLPFRGCITEDGEGYQHRYYWDVQKPLPEIEEGVAIRLTTYGQSIKKMETI